MPQEDFYKQDTVIEEVAEKQPKKDLPEKVASYKIESFLSRGGMSVLYLGLKPESKDPAAIKVLSKKYISNQDVIDKFLREASIIAQADHPNIVKLYGYGRWEGGLYIAMEFVRGVSLRQFIMQNSMSLKKSVEVILQVAYALCHLHTHGVIHRDLKPENILLDENGEIKIIDFGIAQVQPESDVQNKEEKERQKRILGTPVYMSPEQQENPLKVTYASDIFSLGIIAYELILGQLSHGVIHLSLMPRRIQKILAKALQPKVENRYSDIVDFITDLSKYLKSSAVEKDIVGKDQTEELKEHLQNVQRKLTPQTAPQWDKMDVNLINHSGLSIAGVYYDFFKLPNNTYSIIIAEPSARGVEGVIYSSVLRGIIRSLSPTTTQPVEFVTKLNKILAHDPIDQIFTLSYLLLQPQQHSLKYITCGYGNLWFIASGAKAPRKITAENIALGISFDAEFIEISHNWNIGDSLVINTFGTVAAKEKQSKKAFGEKHLQQVLIDNIYASPKKQIEAIFRTISSTAKHALEERPLTLIGVQRKN